MQVNETVYCIFSLFFLQIEHYQSHVNNLMPAVKSGFSYPKAMYTFQAYNAILRAF